MEPGAESMIPHSQSVLEVRKYKMGGTRDAAHYIYGELLKNGGDVPG